MARMAVDAFLLYARRFSTVYCRLPSAVWRRLRSLRIALHFLVQLLQTPPHRALAALLRAYGPICAPVATAAARRCSLDASEHPPAVG